MAAQLGHEDRQHLRRLVDEAKRRRLRREARIYLRPRQCDAATYVGIQCANDAVAGGLYCKLHSRMQNGPPLDDVRDGP